MSYLDVLVDLATAVVAVGLPVFLLVAAAVSIKHGDWDFAGTFGACFLIISMALVVVVASWPGWQWSIEWRAFWQVLLDVGFYVLVFVTALVVGAIAAIAKRWF